MTQPVQRPPEAASDLVHRLASASLPVPSQLIVGADECVVVARHGGVVGVVSSGTHWHQLVDTELWFVKTVPWLGVRFGGPLGAMIDPVTQLRCSPRAMGDFGLVVADPSRFVTACLGASATDAEPILAWVKQLVVKRLGGAVATAVASGKGVTAPDLVIGAQQQVAAEMGNELEPAGLAFTRFGELRISLPEEDVNAMRQIAKERAAAKRAAAAPACPRCGAPVGAGRFCGQCGAPLT